MSEDKKANAEVSKVEAEGGRIIFADDVVATIAALAVSDVEGVSAMTGGVVEGFTEMLGKKNLTKRKAWWQLGNSNNPKKGKKRDED